MLKILVTITKQNEDFTYSEIHELENVAELGDAVKETIREARLKGLEPWDWGLKVEKAPDSDEQ